MYLKHHSQLRGSPFNPCGGSAGNITSLGSLGYFKLSPFSLTQAGHSGTKTSSTIHAHSPANALSSSNRRASLMRVDSFEAYRVSSEVRATCIASLTRNCNRPAIPTSPLTLMGSHEVFRFSEMCWESTQQQYITACGRLHDTLSLW